MLGDAFHGDITNGKRNECFKINLIICESELFVGALLADMPRTGSSV